MSRRFRVAIVLGLTALLAGGAFAVAAGFGDDSPTMPRLQANGQPLKLEGSDTEMIKKRDADFVARRTAGERPLSLEKAASLRASAAQRAIQMRGTRPQTASLVAPASPFGAAWAGLGPNPIVQISRGSTPIFSAMAGRIGALAIRQSGTWILGGAQGGIWTSTNQGGTWTPRTDTLPSLAIGALAVAPTSDTTVYAGTGEGALSGDSYFGNGVLKSTDGGMTWSKISGDYFYGVSISRLVVDPTNASHLYAAVIRGRAGNRRMPPPLHSRYGIWESKNGGVSWSLRKEVAGNNGATDLEIDPQNPAILYASFWGDQIYRSTNGGLTWAPFMAGFPPTMDPSVELTRFSIAISHPIAQPVTLYAGFDWSEGDGYHQARVWKSVGGGAWAQLPGGTSPLSKVQDYCGGQCWYDNVVETDPTNPNVVFAAGQFDYSIGSGGIFRSDDGGTSWKNLGDDQHPDFHALAFDPSNTARVLVGSDGGVWYSTDRGGRPTGAEPLTANTWVDKNGTVNPVTGGVSGRTGLQIGQFTSVATVPTLPARFWGGTQDNGTLRKSTASASWFDVASGDGGQVPVDPTDENYVYGTYYGISPYRFTDGGLFFYSNQFIRNGLNLGDRSAFYTPFTMNRDNPEQLFLGTYRLYRTDNAKAESAGDVEWNAISGDLTTGCEGLAPNGASGCVLSAVGVGGGDAVYTGSLDGRVYLSPDGQSADDPTWTNVNTGTLPNRPVQTIAVDRSNYRIAYLGYGGFSLASVNRPGHVFRTLDGGKTWTNISGNLPDSPVNSLLLDPAYDKVLYAGTDVGPFVTYNGGGTWYPLGTGFPVVSIWQLDMDPWHRTIAAGTHGRGAYKLQDSTVTPALKLSKEVSSAPVGPGSDMTYTLTLENIGNGAATGVTLTDPIPAGTSFVSATDGGTVVSGKVTWTGLSVAAGDALSVSFTVHISDSLSPSVTSIVNDGYKATSAEGPFTTGSPVSKAISPAHDVDLAPDTARDGGRAGTSIAYSMTVTNLGYMSDSFGLSQDSGSWTASFYRSDCSTSITDTDTLAAGDSQDICVKVAVPGGASNNQQDSEVVTATSNGDSSVSDSSTLTSIAVTLNTLLVDGDGDGPDVQSYYSTALTSAGVSFNTWDLADDSDLPEGYLKAHKNVVWFTGNAYPGPILPYEGELTAFLDGGGRLFMSGQDILDQSAGMTDFVHDYLHVDWDGSEAQNDIATTNVTGISGNPVGNAFTGGVPLNVGVLGAPYMDQITPTTGADAAFKDDAAEPNALTYSGTYKVVFLAFPFEEFGNASQKAALMTDAMTFFGP